MKRAGVRRLLSCLADESLFIVDADDDCLAALGYGRDRLVGCSLLDLTHEDDRDVTRDRIDTLMQDGAPFCITKRYIRADGDAMWVTNRVSLFHAGTRRHLLKTIEVLDEAPLDDQRRALQLTAQRILARRRLRVDYFGGEMFGEPGFDLLLDLFVQEASGRQTYTSSAAVASGAPLTTALRQIGLLVDKGLVCRAPDPADRRRVLLKLTAEGAETMQTFLSAAGRI